MAKFAPGPASATVRLSGLINTLIHVIMDGTGMLKEYAAYDLWACRRFVERLKQEPAEILDTEVKNSFPSLRATLMHIRDAQNAWLHRLKKQPFAWPADESMELDTVIIHATALHDHVLGMDREELRKEVEYADLKGNKHRQLAWQMLLHCFNHGTQHRGQLITMMRQLGLQEIPANDLIVFQRQSKALL